mgnify:CR=1 FL=1
MESWEIIDKLNEEFDEVNNENKELRKQLRDLQLENIKLCLKKKFIVEDLMYDIKYLWLDIDRMQEEIRWLNYENEELKERLNNNN